MKHVDNYMKAITISEKLSEKLLSKISHKPSFKPVSKSIEKDALHKTFRKIIYDDTNTE